MALWALIQDRLSSIQDHFFKPSDEQMLKSAEEHGLDLTQPAPFTFYLAFKSRRDADIVAKELSEKGYVVTHETDEEGDQYPHEIEAEVSFIPSASEIKKHDELFKSTAAQYSARYDDYSIGFGSDLPFYQGDG